MMSRARSAIGAICAGFVWAVLPVAAAAQAGSGVSSGGPMNQPAPFGALAQGTPTLLGPTGSLQSGLPGSTSQGPMTPGAATTQGPTAGAATTAGAGTTIGHLLATDRGTSYALPLAVDYSAKVPPTNGQVSAAGRDRAVFTATPPINPLVGARQVAGQPALGEFGPRVGARVGDRIVVATRAGQRLGGGSDSPSPEAIIFDPRDLFDYRVKSLENPNPRLAP